MWLFCEDGFYSIVQDRRDPHVLIVRARDRRDLETLYRRARAAAPASEFGPIVETADTDYRYRFAAPRELVARLAMRTVERIDYPNFKDRIAAVQGSERASLYAQVWALVRDGLQGLGFRKASPVRLAGDAQGVRP